MSRETALVKNTLIISLGTFLPKLVTVITLPILTACLTKDEYGTFDLVTTLLSLLLPVATLKIDTAAFRFLIDCRENKEKTSQVITTIIIFLLPISAVVVSCMYFVFNDLSSLTRIWIIIYLFFDIILNGFQQIVRGLSYNMIYSISAIIRSIVNMVLIVVTVQMADEGLNGVLMAAAVASIIGVIVIFIKAHLLNYIHFKDFSLPLLKNMLSYSWPMIPNSLSLWVMNLSDRIIITGIMGVSANAVFAVANKIPSLLGLIQNTFSFAWQENASIAVEDFDSKEYYSKMFDIIFSLMVGGMALLIAFTPLLFSILIKGEYDEAYYQMPILTGGVFFSALSSFLGGIYVAHKKTKSIGITTIIAAGIKFILSIAFIRVIGLYAASISTLLCYAMLVIYRMIGVRTFQPMEYNYGKIGSSLFVLLILGTICYQRNLYLNIINILFGILFAAFLNKNLIKRGMEMFLTKIKK